jgi:hypothetical protein
MAPTDAEIYDSDSSNALRELWSTEALDARFIMFDDYYEALTPNPTNRRYG